MEGSYWVSYWVFLSQKQNFLLQYSFCREKFTALVDLVFGTSILEEQSPWDLKTEGPGRAGPHTSRPWKRKSRTQKLQGCPGPDIARNQGLGASPRPQASAVSTHFSALLICSCPWSYAPYGCV